MEAYRVYFKWRLFIHTCLIFTDGFRFGSRCLGCSDWGGMGSTLPELVIPAVAQQKTASWHKYNFGMTIINKGQKKPVLWVVWVIQTPSSSHDLEVVIFQSWLPGVKEILENVHIHILIMYAKECITSWSILRQTFEILKKNACCLARKSLSDMRRISSYCMHLQAKNFQASQSVTECHESHSFCRCSNTRLRVIKTCENQ